MELNRDGAEGWERVSEVSLVGAGLLFGGVRSAGWEGSGIKWEADGVGYSMICWGELP